MANTADVLIVGGGVIGLCIAHRLASSGLEVAVLDRGADGRASPAAGGLLSTPLESADGDPFFELCIQSRRLYPELVQTLREQTDIDVEYLPWGALELIRTEAQRGEWMLRVDELRKRDLGVDLLSGDELRKLEPQIGDFPLGAALLSDDHHLNNEELLRALQQACTKLSVRRIERCDVRKLLRKGDHVLGAESSEGWFTAAETVVAGGSWSSALLKTAGLPLPLEPIRGQMLALRSDLPVRHVLAMGERYMVPRLSGELLVGSTLEEVGFQVANTAGALHMLSALALEMCPALATAEVSRIWAGLRPRTPDAMPVLGRYSTVRGLLVATGHYRNGILLTPVTARVIAELLLEGGSTMNLEPFSPDRFVPKG